MNASLPLPTLSEMTNVLPVLTNGVRQDLNAKFRATHGKSLHEMNDNLKRHSLIVATAFLARLRDKITMEDFLSKITEQLAVFAGMRYHLLDIIGTLPEGDAADEGRGMLLDAEQELATITENFIAQLQKLASKEEGQDLVWSSTGWRMVERLTISL